MLGLEGDVVRNARLAQTFVIARPFLWQIQPIGHRQTRMIIGKRQRHRDLAVVLLAEPATILPRNADRMPALLRKAGIIDDPGLDRPLPLDLRQHHLAYLGQNRLVRPMSLAHKMQKRLVLRRHPRRRRYCRQRLHALALTRHHQPGAIVPQRLRTIRVPNHAHKPLDILSKSRFNRPRSSMTHRSLRADVNLAV